MMQLSFTHHLSARVQQVLEDAGDLRRLSKLPGTARQFHTTGAGAKNRGEQAFCSLAGGDPPEDKQVESRERERERDSREREEREPKKEIV